MVPKVLLDVNICLDVLLDRKPYVTFSGKLFELSENNVIHPFISGISFDTLFYIIRPELGHKKTTSILKHLTKHIDIAPVSKKVVMQALEAGWTDLEDALQYFSAYYSDCDYVITRDIKDFSGSKKSLIACSPQKFLEENFQ